VYDIWQAVAQSVCADVILFRPADDLVCNVGSEAGSMVKATMCHALAPQFFAKK
jgi:hypothetical protein